MVSRCGVKERARPDIEHRVAEPVRAGALAPVGRYGGSGAAPEMLLALQRTHGNAAVQRMMAAARQQPPGEAPPARPLAPSRALQRRVGFEVELSVPTYKRGDASHFRAGPGGPSHRNVEGLLTGGQAYDTPLGTLAPGIEMKTDHNRLQHTGRAIYAALEAMRHNGLRIVREGAYVPISNLEYATPALDEFEPGWSARFKAQADAIDAHAQQIFTGTPDTQAMALPGTSGFATGLPLTQLSAWLGPALSSDVDLLTALTNFASQIEWDMYIQATAGVVPSGMPGLFEKRASESPEGALRDAIQAVVRGVQALRQDPILKSLVLFDNPELQDEQQAFLGGLYLGLSYAVGNALNQTDILQSTGKNAVPLLIKTTDIGAFARATTTRQQRTAPSPDLIGRIAAWFHAPTNVPETAVAYWTTNYAANPAPERGRRYGSGADPVQDTKDMLTRLLAGSGGVGARGTGKLEEPDEPSASIAGGLSGQKGLPLEYRWITERPRAPGQLWPVMKKVLDEVRSANLKV